MRGREKGFVADGDSAALAVAQRAQHQPVSERGWDTQPGGYGFRIRPGRRALSARLERPHNRCTAGRLHRIHPRQRTTDPATVPQLLKGLPHADESCPATSGINDGIRQAPTELFGELEAECLLALDAVGLLQSRDIDGTGVVGVQPRGDAAVADVAVHELKIAAERANLCEDGGRRIRWRIDAWPHAGARGVRG